DNTRALMQRLPADERESLYWRPESYTWRDYFIGTHIPGLEKYVFPDMKEELADKPRLAHMHRDLVDMFESTTYANRHRVAARFLDGETFEHLTYAELRLLAERVSAYVLDTIGPEPGETRIMLVCENRPEWVAAYFGILRAGCTVVPVDAFASAEQIREVAKVADVRGIIVSPTVAERASIDGAWPLRDAVRFKDRLIVPKAPARVASLVFTTGTSKGVMLSHRNFTFEVSRLAGIFPLDEKDHLLSVLPLHHTFEFTAGLLVPLSRGATVTYVSELSGDTLQRALEDGVTGLIGVPALWELLRDRIETRVNDNTRLAGFVLDGIKVVNNFLRQHTELNLGPLLAYPVHRALGGRLKYLVSSGSTLSPDVLAFFRGVGFNMTEGYALTEAAPIVTVTDPLDPMVPGSVGKPLHGVDVTIEHPDEHGIGEVLMRGPNVMLGYWGSHGKPLDAPPSRGWLRTGDMGRMDEEGRLFLVGRKGATDLDRYGQNPAIREVADQRAIEAARVSAPADAEHVAVPVSVATAGKRLLQWTQKKFYQHVMDVDVRGRGYIPRDTSFIVAANHTSHLDAGLVQEALGAYGKNLVPLAAADYFFSTKTRRAYFEHFTNVRPVARRGAYEAMFADALAAIDRGHSLLLFPEGTRSRDGRMQSFQHAIGYLAMHAQRPVLPMYLSGTHEALPKGAPLLPRARGIGAAIGLALQPSVFAALGEPGPETYASATALIEKAIAALRDVGGYRVEELRP
ncbi:MAG: AMP-binding protein, partial [Clostridia bacterium]|nr:AMP-binding protein [Deltaproteobacteria bacterium]